MNMRNIPAAALLVVALCAAVAAARSDTATWHSIWIGAAFTCLAAALVDGVAVIEASRREKVIRASASRRLEQARRNLDMLTRLVLDLSGSDDLGAALRAMRPPRTIDLSGPARVRPPRSKQQLALQLRQQLVSDVDVLTTFAAVGVYAEAIATLDQIVHVSSFGILLRDLFAVEPSVEMSDKGQMIRELSTYVDRLDGLLA